MSDRLFENFIEDHTEKVVVTKNILMFFFFKKEYFYLILPCPVLTVLSIFILSGYDIFS